MGIKITSIKEALDNNGIKILIHSLAGCGKTVACATTGAPTLIISAEAGLLSLADAPDHIKTTVIYSIDDLEKVYDYLTLENGLRDYEWIALDSISEIAEVLLAEEKNKSKDPRQAYGNLSERMMKIMRMFRDLAINVIITCKTKRQEDQDSGIVTFVPMLPGAALTQNISYMFDEVFALRVEQDTDEDGKKFDYRILQTGRCRRYEAKDRSGKLDPFEEVHIGRLVAKIRGEEYKLKTKMDGVADTKVVEKIEKTTKISAEEESIIEEEIIVTNKVETAGDADVQTLDEEAVAQVEEDEAENAESVIADKKLYWIHAESESVGAIEKGDSYKPKRYSSQGAEFVGLVQYKKAKKTWEAIA